MNKVRTVVAKIIYWVALIGLLLCFLLLAQIVPARIQDIGTIEALGIESSKLIAKIVISAAAAKLVFLRILLFHANRRQPILSKPK